MRRQSRLLRCSIKQVYKGEASVLHAKPFSNLVKANITPETGGSKEQCMSTVFVVDSKKQPLDPIHPGRARLLLKAGKAAVLKRYPFTLLLKVAVQAPQVHPLRLKLDPGSRTTGIAIVNDQSGAVVFAAE